ncbi:MAG: hypothetical protein R6X19_00590 [Kiritimatiellia bacterium]
MSRIHDPKNAGADPGRDDEREPVGTEEYPAPRRRPRRERGVVLFADRSGSIIRAGADTDEESMPVLNAFRQFLEAERRRSRRQLIALVCVFSALVAALLGSGGWYLKTRLARLESGIESDKIRSQEDLLASVSNMQSVARAAVSLKKDVVDTRKLSAVLNEKVAEQSGELSKLIDTITTLEIQNSLLQGSFRKMAGGRRPDPALDWEAYPAPVTTSPVQVQSPPVQSPPVAAPRAAPIREEAKPIPAWEPPQAPGPADQTPVPVDTTPGGVPFRLPLPRG